jgi:DNA primase catalytic subunit
MSKGWGLSFCQKAFEISKENTIRLFEKLKEDYSKVKIVFSGRGFHIHVFDDKAIKFDRKKRKKIAEKYNKYGIDKWVTTGEMRLIRLPYTLNAISSRIVLPLDKKKTEKFDAEKDALPKFLK